MIANKVIKIIENSGSVQKGILQGLCRAKMRSPDKNSRDEQFSLKRNAAKGLYGQTIIISAESKMDLHPIFQPHI